ncbi:PE domain-containing protein [Mycobacterium marinum]|uniref:PE domain-containing protein n=1 Tax=Mycobacterium marinum TaxID=1781 RepID=UPI000B977410|nr:PE domain-containing protein [Mycobacterium marinum]MDC8995597.1 PE domain-containing protein [Mycobacterium marinum]WDZ14000.1 PE domain-containing protein [Mycobacterium marinum]
MEQKSHGTAIADIGTLSSGNARIGVTSDAAALTSVTGVVPAGADEVSTQAAAAFAAEGAQLLASSSAAQRVIRRAGESPHRIAPNPAEVSGGATSVIV